MLGIGFYLNKHGASEQQTIVSNFITELKNEIPAVRSNKVLFICEASLGQAPTLCEIANKFHFVTSMKYADGGNSYGVPKGPMETVSMADTMAIMLDAKQFRISTEFVAFTNLREHKTTTEMKCSSEAGLDLLKKEFCRYRYIPADTRGSSDIRDVRLVLSGKDGDENDDVLITVLMSKFWYFVYINNQLLVD